jgi:HAD superfamily hydrolase (TIGR01509 family)
LVQSNWLHASAWKDAFGVAGIDLDLETIRRQIGKGGDELIPFFVLYWRRRIIEEPLKAYRKLVFQQRYLDKVQAFASTRELFQEMKKSGIEIALASSANQDELETYKAIARISDLVDTSTTADDVKRSKPHPDIFETALHKVGVKPSRALAPGDTPWDAESAAKAEVRIVGVMTGGWTENELYDAGCIEVYKDVGALLDRFSSSAFVTL